MSYINPNIFSQYAIMTVTMEGALDQMSVDVIKDGVG